MTDWDEAFRLEREAVERLNAALATIGHDLQWYWGWGDGQGGYLLEKLAEVVRANGCVWPFDPAPASRVRKKAVISRSLRRQVMERDAYRCVTCESYIDLTCDHIVPESKGGPTTADNLQTMCRSCNSRKGTRQ